MPLGVPVVPGGSRDASAQQLRRPAISRFLTLFPARRQLIQLHLQISLVREEGKHAILAFDIGGSAPLPMVPLVKFLLVVAGAHEGAIGQLPAVHAFSHSLVQRRYHQHLLLILLLAVINKAHVLVVAMGYALVLEEVPRALSQAEARSRPCPSHCHRLLLGRLSHQLRLLPRRVRLKQTVGQPPFNGGVVGSV